MFGATPVRCTRPRRLSKTICNVQALYRAKRLYFTEEFCDDSDKQNLQNKCGAKLPSQAQVVIAGAGIVANSVAYHLTLQGCNDVLVLEQNSIGSGTSRFGSGMIGMFNPTSQKRLVMYSLELYSQLQKMGHDIGFHQCGSINLAQTQDRMIALKRRMAYNVPAGLHCELLSKLDLQKLYPYLNVEDLEGAVWVPEDAVADSMKVCSAFVTLAKKGGAQYVEQCRIKKVHTQNGAVNSVETTEGTVKCEFFVNCAGMWSRELGLKCCPPVKIPAYPAELLYATISLNVNANLPIIRDYDSYTHMREWPGGLLVGWFEKEARPAFENKPVPSENWMEFMKTDPNHWKPLWSKAVHRLPQLKGVFEPAIYNCPDTFTPDGRMILGPSPEVKNYFVAGGMNGMMLQGAGGIGKEVAQWIIHGESTHELLPFQLQRFLDLHSNKKYLQQRTREVVGRNFTILYPHQCEYKYARKLRCSPLYSLHEQRGAIFGIKMAYERPLYFDSTYEKGQRKPEMPPGSFYKPKFFNFMKEEFYACREGVGVIDMSSFSKIKIKSNKSEAVNYLQKLCSANVDVPVGTIVHTGMQNERGGYENDCMLVRQAENRFFMVSPTMQQTRIYQWMSKHIPSDHSVKLDDVTSKYTVINLVGPKASQLLSEMSNSNINLPSFTYKEINVGYASDVMLMAFTHTGEPGFCLYVPSEYALHVYSMLMDIGQDYGSRDVGVLTQRFMRLERFIPFWAEELTPFVTPFEAGRSHSVKLDKEYFIGKYALQRQKEQGITKRLVLFVLHNLDADTRIWPWGGEPIYRNGEFVGTVTSAGYGFCLQKLICIGFIRRPRTKNVHDRVMTTDFIVDPTANYEIDIAGERFAAKPHILPLPIVTLDKLDSKYTPTPVYNHKTDIHLAI